MSKITVKHYVTIVRDVVVEIPDELEAGDIQDKRDIAREVVREEIEFPTLEGPWEFADLDDELQTDAEDHYPTGDDAVPDFRVRSVDHGMIPAAEWDRVDSTSSAARQHFIDTGTYPSVAPV